MSYARRVISVTITLAEGQFGDTAGDVVTLTGLRTRVVVAVAGGASQGQLHARIYGLPLETINQLTQIGPIATQVRRANTIQVAAGDADSGQTVVFEGVIREAYGDFQSAPNVVLNIVANSALAAAVVPVGANSWKGSVNAAEIMETLAGIAGLAFENNGVSVQLSNPYFPGTALTQIQSCARAANINYSTENGVLAIWPMNGQREGAIPLVSPDTGMVGYPVFTSNGLNVTSLFVPNLRQGGQIQVQSSIPIACGTWRVSNLVHDLESETPDGAWFTQIGCYNKNDGQ